MSDTTDEQWSAPIRTENSNKKNSTVNKEQWRCGRAKREDDEMRILMMRKETYSDNKTNKMLGSSIRERCSDFSDGAP